MRRARWIRDCPATETLFVPCTREGRFVRVKVEAAISGPLAIHPATGRDVPRWTVTHIATGYAIAHFDDETEGEEFVRMILSLDWNFAAVSALPKATAAGVLVVAGAHGYRLAGVRP